MTKAHAAVFFDVDGVLLDSIAAKGEAFVQAFGDFPEHADAIRVLHRENGGVPRARKIAMIREDLCGLSPDSEDVARRIDNFAAAVLQRVVTAPEIQGATVALVDLSADYSLHAVSATPTSELGEIIDARGWTGHFQSVHGVPPDKAETMAELMSLHGYHASSCFMIGDSAQDRMAARLNGVPFILVAGSTGPEGDEVAVVPDLRSLPMLIRGGGRMTS